MNIIIFIVLTCVFENAYSARILASVPTASYSHQIVFRPIWKELAKRGHHIVLMTTDPMEDTENITQIDMSFSYDLMKKEKYNEVVMKAKENRLEFIEKFVKIFTKTSFEQLRHPEVQKMIHNKSEHFDLIMVEIVFPLHLGLLERFAAPIIGLSSFEINNRFHEVLGNTAHPVINPDSTVVPFFHPLTLKERIISSLVYFLSEIYGEFFLEAEFSSKMREIFGEKCRSMIDLVGEIDMVFINSNPILHTVRALSPTTIQFGGGFHLEKETKSLPQDLKRYLDNATNGVIYFSLGTNIKSYLLKDSLKQIFLETFAELPYKVLWKFENENLPNKPDNIWISKWFPQSDIFKHPNIKLFITQCGLQSMEEAILNHIPMVGIPFIVDQPANAMIMERKGLGLTLNYESLTKEIFKETIEEVIRNSEYKKNTLTIAELMNDVEMNGIEKVVWWTEYVIRNKGAKILRNTSRHLPFYQCYLIDVITVVALVVFSFVYISKKILFSFFNKVVVKTK
ncbi:hypothetical protein WA026_014802 [Henosepilachna vigintioctopunctata]|uniref:UDP-glucuronosyltransferase n=1 Tax=Henosepilachna vigintioctopunctata TaxID=420089 RepID=A0AAW1UR59_9CUCU